jgi:hypothetical protein
MTKLTHIASLNEIAHIEYIKWIPVSDKEHAWAVLDSGEYTVAWYYRPRKNTCWLIVRKEEYSGA